MSQPIQKLFRMIENRTANINFYLHLVMAIVAFMLYGYTNAILDESYAASNFPVPYYEGQTTFSGDQIKEYYAYMIEAGTLDIYWQTQVIDYAFIASVIFMGLLLPSFIAKLHLKGSWLFKGTMLFAFLIPLGGLFDALENLVSFAMLARPETFPNWLAIIYSSFATLKFASMVPALMGTLISLIIAILLYLVSLLRTRKVLPVL
ncbi:MAG: hypothetical protein AB8G95_07845 [Anaerolineae bacterium]